MLDYKPLDAVSIPAASTILRSKEVQQNPLTRLSAGFLLVFLSNWGQQRLLTSSKCWGQHWGQLEILKRSCPQMPLTAWVSPAFPDTFGKLMSLLEVSDAEKAIYGGVQG
ncbi:MAG: hypothetical protein KF771_11820 [Burkholderiales bacterium]|nr:hypothetical protein [Burkholderiales bacterium]